MATRMMERNNVADGFVKVQDPDTRMALNMARKEVGEPVWKQGYSPESKETARRILKEQGVRYEEKLTGKLVGVQVGETQANGETKKKLRVTLDDGRDKTILSADLSSEFAQRLVAKLDTAISEHPGEVVTIGGFASPVERDGRTFVNHVATMKDAEGQEVTANPEHNAKAAELVKAAQKPLLDAGMSDKKILGQLADNAREKYFTEVAESLSARMAELGLSESQGKGHESYRGLKAGVEDKDRKGVWYNLTAYQKEGEDHLVGVLHLRDKNTGEQEKVPLVFEDGPLGGMQAEAVFSDGKPLVVTLSRSEPSEGRDAHVQMRIFAKGQDLDGKETLEQIHDDKTRYLRMTPALEALGENSREAQLMQERFGVGLKALEPYKAPELNRTPAKAQERQKEMAR